MAHFSFEAKVLFVFLIDIKNILVENTDHDNYVKYHWVLVNLGRWSDQCKPPARFLLG